MNEKIRYLPSWPLPLYRFIPGKNIHPNKAGGHMFENGDLITDPLDQSMPSENNFLRFSIDLFNHQYYWECHVYLEALWNAHGRKGTVADFLKALIKLGAAGVKINLNEATDCSDHLLRARELLMSVKATEGDLFLGFNLDDLITNIDNSILKIKNNSLDAIFLIHPNWT